MISKSYMPYVVQHMCHLEEWTDDKAAVLNANAHACAISADSHHHWPDAIKTIECDLWARVGISGVDAALPPAAPVNMRQRLAAAAREAGILLHRGGPLVVDDKTYIKPIIIGDHWVVNPDHATEWGTILIAELDPLMSDGPYDALFLDKYGDLPYFLVQNGITPTPQDTWQWGRMLVELVRRISRECGRWGVALYVNGSVEQNYRQAITGPMYENIPHEATWSDHFHEIMHDAWVYNGKVIVGENGGKYRRECLALSMLFDCWFAPRTQASVPLGIPIADAAHVVGEWFPCENRPVKPVEPCVWRRMFWSPREHVKRVCEMKFDPDWKRVQVTLPWDK